MSVPLIHCTDLFHPPADPDDTWDLATVFALAQSGHVDLRGVVFDWLQEDTARKCFWAGDPGVVTLAQMNYITGRSVPGAVGSSVPLRSMDDAHTDLPPSERAGVQLILQILRESETPVAIDIVGSSIDVALAFNASPDLFAEKCRGIYMIAGTGTTDPAKGANNEHNLSLDRKAFRVMFGLPCPVYWCPCIGSVIAENWVHSLKPDRFSSFWRFTQSEILSHLSPIVQNYFTYGLGVEKSALWLRYLRGEGDAEKMAKIGAQERNMWSTAHLFQLAGLAVRRDGAIIPETDESADRVFGFRPISVRTCEAGMESWKDAPGGTDRFILEILDLENYASAMTRALGDLLAVL